MLLYLFRHLKNHYYALIYSFSYEILVWGNTYKSILQALFILQKNTIRIITFSNFDDQSSRLFKQLNIIKMNDLVTLKRNSLPKAITNYEISIIKFQGDKIWNEIPETTKISLFKEMKKKVKTSLIEKF